MEIGDSYMSCGAVSHVITLRNHTTQDIRDFILNRPSPYNILRRAQPEPVVYHAPIPSTLHPQTVTTVE